MIESKRTEWSVAWFPPDKPDQERIYTSERKAMDRFVAAREQGHFPILCERVVEIHSWRQINVVGR